MPRASYHVPRWLRTLLAATWRCAARGVPQGRSGVADEHLRQQAAGRKDAAQRAGTGWHCTAWWRVNYGIRCWRRAAVWGTVRCTAITGGLPHMAGGLPRHDGHRVQPERRRERNATGSDTRSVRVGACAYRPLRQSLEMGAHNASKERRGERVRYHGFRARWCIWHARRLVSWAEQEMRHIML